MADFLTHVSRVGVWLLTHVTYAFALWYMLLMMWRIDQRQFESARICALAALVMAIIGIATHLLYGG